ncbi:hypothetical protein PDG61_00690 [Mycolicibacterium sp. BiH015]|uniref:hypothetical protein n=1 Tax=Mycolicibacterium sp. BiH015 TaxID=3018808 RepID=UPI0022E9758D|nr:hypothetical protein [Mycolicibacterium sp. BiH015]MDA2889419.1 hypothetical protein [Mycolicibacterium sp. BiH015]
MSERAARHRIAATAGSQQGFWSERDLCNPEEAGARRHARTVESRHAVHIGRVGALAVSLGIGLAIANSATGTAAAETESSSSSASADQDSSSAAGGTQNETGPSGADGPASTSDEDVSEESDEGALGSDEEDLDDEAADSDLADETAELIAADEESAGEPEGSDADAQTARHTTKRTVPVTTEAVEVDAPAADDVAAAHVLNAVVANAVAPLADPELPAPSPVTDGVLAWIRRLITHTFFNKTPVVREVETEQILTGQTIITIDAYDPNGDPLTYEIIQPQGGLVFREPLTGAFVYTPTVPVIGDEVPVKFDVVIRDDSEHLTGILGSLQNVLHSIARIFGLAQRDNYTQTIEFTAKPVLQTAPTLVVTGGLPYLIGSDPVTLLSSATIVDVDSPSMAEATVTIGIGRQDGDRLHYVAPEGVDIDVEQINDHTLKFTGLASQDDYEKALKAITFSTTDLGLVARTVDLSIIDQHGLENVIPAFVATVVLPGLPLDAPPSILAVGGLPYFLGGDPVRLLSVAEIEDLDSASLQQATITISDLTRSTGDTLGYDVPDGIDIDVDYVNDWTIVLSGVATKADYETALKAITFSATQLGIPARTVEITLTDADDVDSLAPALVAATVLPGIVAELPLIVTPVGLPVHTIGKPPVKLLSSVVIANADDGQLDGAVVTIGLNRQNGDKLGFTAVVGNPVTITQTNDWTITLSGTGTVEQYQQALQSITFSATTLGLPRTVTISVTEGDGDTSPAPGIVFANSVLPLRPTIVTPPLPGIHTIGGAGSVVAPVVTIADLDSTVLTGAVVALGVGRQTGDKLSFTAAPGSSITASWNGTDTLTLSGTASVEEYTAALQAVTFSATGGAGVPRTVTINIVDDSGLNALVPGVTTALVKNPDRPTVVTVGLAALNFPTVGDTVKPITLATIVDTDSTVLSGASVKITDRFTTGDTLAFAPIDGNPITAAYNTATGELKLTGTATIAQYKQALEAVTFKATRYGGGLLDVLGITRTLSVYVTDDTNATNLLPGVVAVTVFR